DRVRDARRSRLPPGRPPGPASPADRSTPGVRVRRGAGARRGKRHSLERVEVSQKDHRRCRGRGRVEPPVRRATIGGFRLVEWLGGSHLGPTPERRRRPGRRTTKAREWLPPRRTRYPDLAIARNNNHTRPYARRGRCPGPPRAMRPWTTPPRSRFPASLESLP